VTMCAPSIVCCGFYWGGLQHAARRVEERRGKDSERRGGKGGKGDRQQRVRGRKTVASERHKPGQRRVLG
jgi:hypothetical protein